MMSAALERYKWPKLHERVVEECRSLDVSDVLTLDAFHRARLRSWSPPTHPWLLLVSRWGGPFRRWWFECPECGRRCETLYRPPGPLHEDWGCRMCWDLIYASQRYGRRHPERQVLTRRKRVTRAKRAEQLARVERARAREMAKARREFEKRAAREARANRHRSLGRDQAAAGPSASLAGPFALGQPSDMEQVRAATEADLLRLVPLALATLQEISATSRSGRLRQRARGSLRRYSRWQGAQQSRPATPVPASPTCRPPAPHFTPEETASIERVLAEDIAPLAIGRARSLSH